MKTAAEVISMVQPGHRVFVHGAAAVPTFLLNALVEQAGRLKNVELVHLHLEGPVLHSKPEFKENFKVVNLFVGPSMRSDLNFDQVDYLPCFLSEIPQLFRSGKRPLDVAIIHVSPPDNHGFCTLGTSTDVARAAI